MSPWTEPYEPDDDDVPRPAPVADEISLGVGGDWYVSRYTLEECRREFPGSSLVAHPEHFDRFYARSAVGPLLVDILVGDSTENGAAAGRKRVAFKREWCTAHDRRYLVLTEDDVSVAKIRAMLADAPALDPAAAAEPDADRAPAPQRRGGIQRPKATA